MGRPHEPRTFGRVVDRIASLRVLLIVTFRPEFEPPWIGRPHVTALTLNRLAQREVDAMIDARRRQQAAASEHPAGHHRAHRRHSAVRGGDDEGGAGGGERGRSAADCRRGSVAGAGGPGKPARLADGAARPARPRQGGGADRRGDRARVLPCPAGCGGAQAGGGAGNRRSTVSFAAGLLFRQGVPPHATYLFKHALVQDAAYGTLLREPRRALHARIAETLESQFAEIAENQPELLARHCTEAGLIEKAAGLWGKAGQRSLERSALVEAAEQLTRALDQIATLPATPALRREADQASGWAHQRRSSMSKAMRRRKPKRPWSGHVC